MNYIAELNAFHRWCENHPLPMSSQFLWFKLMDKNNRLGWCEWVSVDNLELMSILGLRREHTAISIRDTLIKEGLVEVIRGKKGVPNKYKMISLANLKVETAVENNTLSDLKVNTAVETAVNTAVETAVNTAVETADINKRKPKPKPNLNQTEEENETRARARSPSATCDDLQRLDPRVQEAFGEYIKARVRLKRPMTPHAVSLAVKKLRGLAGDDANLQIAHIEQAIEHGWLSFYPIKHDAASGSGPSKPVSFADLYRQDYGEEVQKFGS